MSDAEKIEQLEIALAHQDRQIQDMSDMLGAQWKEIERLKRHLTKTEEKLQDYIDSAGEDAGLSPTEIAARDKPPHY
ncbi:MAG: SlyX family protein [Rhodospirillales bacterium]|nr:SlyX family protein [Rhodospirillales bacterium]MCB9995343.1 SlyX family protein [Rhodospirillales bacterium]